MQMAKGTSGRVVIEVDPALKAELYETLDRDGLTLKDWFVQRASRYVANRIQLPLALATPDEEELQS
jgi:hypothetical protein